MSQAEVSRAYDAFCVEHGGNATHILHTYLARNVQQPTQQSRRANFNRLTKDCKASLVRLERAGFEGFTVVVAPIINQDKDLGWAHATGKLQSYPDVLHADENDIIGLFQSIAFGTELVPVAKAFQGALNGSTTASKVATGSATTSASKVATGSATTSNAATGSMSTSHNPKAPAPSKSIKGKAKATSPPSSDNDNEGNTTKTAHKASGGASAEATEASRALRKEMGAASIEDVGIDIFHSFTHNGFAWNQLTSRVLLPERFRIVNFPAITPFPIEHRMRKGVSGLTKRQRQGLETALQSRKLHPQAGIRIERVSDQIPDISNLLLILRHDYTRPPPSPTADERRIRCYWRSSSKRPVYNLDATDNIWFSMFDLDKDPEPTNGQPLNNPPTMISKTKAKTVSKPTSTVVATTKKDRKSAAPASSVEASETPSESESDGDGEAKMGASDSDFVPPKKEGKSIRPKQATQQVRTHRQTYIIDSKSEDDDYDDAALPPFKKVAPSQDPPRRQASTSGDIDVEMHNANGPNEKRQRNIRAQVGGGARAVSEVAPTHRNSASQQVLRLPSEAVNVIPEERQFGQRRGGFLKPYQQKHDDSEDDHGGNGSSPSPQPKPKPPMGVKRRAAGQPTQGEGTAGGKRPRMLMDYVDITPPSKSGSNLKQTKPVPTKPVPTKPAPSNQRQPPPVGSLQRPAPKTTGNATGDSQAAQRSTTNTIPASAPTQNTRAPPGDIPTSDNRATPLVPEHRPAPSVAHQRPQQNSSALHAAPGAIPAHVGRSSDAPAFVAGSSTGTMISAALLPALVRQWDTLDEGRKAWYLEKMDDDMQVKFLGLLVTPGSNRIKANWEEIKETLKDMTGTFAFMAIAILEERGERHDIVHDLESVYWVLIWLVLRHTKHCHPHGANACRNLFDAPKASGKLAWLNLSSSTELLPDKETPLRELLLELAEVIHVGALTLRHVKQPISYEKWCTMLQDALRLSGWPVNDTAIPYKLVSANKPHLNGEKARQSQARERRSIQQQQQLGAPAAGPLKRGSDQITDPTSQASKKRKTTPPSSRPATFEGSP
ncbi:Pkinase-fungal domain-containing protein [Mycena indigotica]|uniref:Pkinase-fungal domain-containing protein n=1 Tax=Mycena indigotica TaxID=2126181 RepID=A0A8H6SIH3_9AGAR|nr:Pkinase-fungal domain-containing protein [Mycena indigotica]KAF7299370.1 Pkinase-fungal domain-containing protein [Mycena indigotica]